MADPELNEPPTWQAPRHPMAVLATVVTLAYVVAIATYRYSPLLQPWTIEGDAKQVIWMFYRYADPGTLPSGNLLFDYSWAYNAPPFYRAIMIPLSTVMDPIRAGHLLQIVLWVAALVAIYVVCRRQVHHYAGLAAVALFAQSPWWHKMAAGGYPRTFGPTLTLIFLAVWLGGHRRAAIGLLVLMAGTHPSPMMGCGLAFGVWTLWNFLKDRQWRPVVELSVAGAVMLALALSQELWTPSWYGPAAWYDEVIDHGAYQRGSRFPFVPHTPLFEGALLYLGALFHHTGHQLFDGLGKWNREHHFVLLFVPLAVAAVLGAVRRIPFPPRLALLFGSAFIAYALSRALAFKLHVPSRPLTHMWPALLAVIVVLVVFMTLKAWLPRRPRLAALLGVLLSVGPVLVIQGDGLGTWPVYGSHVGDAPLFRYLQNKTPKDAVVGGSFRGTDLVGLFGHRIPYVNWTLAHPFRLGYFAEIERRAVRNYEALWASDAATVTRFGQDEGVDYMLVDVRLFDRFDDAGSIVRPFPPITAKIRPFFDAGRRAGFVLKDAGDAVVFKHRHWRLVDISKLKNLGTTVRPGSSPGAPAADGPPDDAPAEAGEAQ